MCSAFFGWIVRMCVRARLSQLSIDRSLCLCLCLHLSLSPALSLSVYCRDVYYIGVVIKFFGAGALALPLALASRSSSALLTSYLCSKEILPCLFKPVHEKPYQDNFTFKLALPSIYFI